MEYALQFQRHLKGSRLHYSNAVCGIPEYSRYAEVFRADVSATALAQIQNTWRGGADYI